MRTRADSEEMVDSGDVADGSPAEVARSGRRRRRYGLVLLATAVPLLIAFGVWRLWFRDTATPVSLADVVEDFRSTEAGDGNSEPPSISVMAPPLGVYVYDTSGSERIDALGGAEHSYPSTTTITVRSSSCGVELVWTALEERIETWDLCVRDGELSLAGYSTFHRFFGQDDLKVYACEPAIVLLRTTSAIGDVSRTSCRAGELTETLTAELRGVGTVEVGEAIVDVVQVDIATELDSADGRTAGDGAIQMWLATDSGLVVNWSEDGSTVAPSAVGSIGYAESYDLRLRSIEPTR